MRKVVYYLMLFLVAAGLFSCRVSKNQAYKDALATYGLSTNTARKDTLESSRKEVKAKISENGYSYEAGFWVFKAPDGTLHVGNTKWGPAAAPGGTTPAYIFAGSPAPGANGVPAGSVPVTFIHTHPPMTYADNGYRHVGFSDQDKIWANGQRVDIAVYDYMGNRNSLGEYVIQAGHNINDPAKFYIYEHK